MTLVSFFEFGALVRLFGVLFCLEAPVLTSPVSVLATPFRLLVLLVPLLLTTAASADDDDSIQFALSHEAGSAGQVLQFRLSWANNTLDPVRVPADLLERISLSGSFCPAGVPCPKHGYGHASVRPPGTPASTLSWRTVLPGQAIERFGRLEEIFPKACKGGPCQAGTYDYQALSGARRIVEMADDQVDPPSIYFRRPLELKSPVLAIRDAQNSPAAIKSVSRPKNGEITVVAVVKNRHPFPVWVPNASALLVECPLDVEWADGRKERLDEGVGVGGQQPYDETEATRVAPGGTVRITVKCSAPPAGLRRAKLNLRLRPFRAFHPTRTYDTPHYVDVDLHTPGYPLRLR